MKTAAKKLLSILLTLILACGLLAETPLAASPSDTYPSISGPSVLTLTEGYAAVSTDVFTITGDPAPTVTKYSGNVAITWNDSTKRLDIASGLTVGYYYVELRASNSSGMDAGFDFTLTVTGDVCEIVGGASYASFKDAVDAAASGQTIRYLKNYYDNTPVVVDGKTIYVDVGNNTLNLCAPYSGAALTVQNGGKVLQTGAGAGRFNLSGYSCGLAAQGAGTEVVITSGTVAVTHFNANYNAIKAEDGAAVSVTGSVSGTDGHIVYALDGAQVTVNGTITGFTGTGVSAQGDETQVTVNGSIVTGTGNTSSGTAAYASGGARITLNGDVSGKDGVSAYGGAVVTVNGNVTATSGNGANTGFNGAITVTGNINGSRGVLCGGGTITVYGDVTGVSLDAVDASGTNGAVAQVMVNGNVLGRVLVRSGAEVTIEGAIIAGSQYISINYTNVYAPNFTSPTTKAGYYTYTDGESTVWVRNPDTPGVCEIVGGARYDWFKAAVDAAADGQTIRMLANATETTPVVVDGKTVYLDMGNYTLTLSTPMNQSKALLVRNGGQFLQTGTGTGGFSITGQHYSIYAETGGIVSVSGSIGGYIGMHAEDPGTQITLNGNVAGDNTGVGARHGAEVTINGDVSGSVGCGIIDGKPDPGGTVILITGNVTNDMYGGVYLTSDMRIAIGGNVTGGSCGVTADYDSTGSVTVDGAITAPVYITIRDIEFTEDDFTEPTTKDGYDTYTDGQSTVWVKTVVLEPFCEIVETGIKYGKLSTALAALANGQTLRLVADYAPGKDVVISNGKTFTFDTNSKILNFGGCDLTVQDGSRVTFDGCDKLKNIGSLEALGDGNDAIVLNGSVKLGALLSIGVEVLSDGRYRGGDNPPKITVNGDVDVTTDYIGVTAEYGGEITVNGNVALSGEGTDARTYLNGVLTVTGDVTAFSAWGSLVGSLYGTVNIGGNVTLSETGSYIACNGEADAEVNIGGNVLFPGEDAQILVGYGCKINIAGNIFAEKFTRSDYPLIEAQGPGTEVTLGGMVTSGVAALAWNGATVTFNGNVSAGGSFGAGCSRNGTILVNGSFTVADRSDYIRFYAFDAASFVAVAKTPYPATVTIGGVDYYEYAYDDGKTNPSYVYVKTGTPPAITGPTVMNLTAGYAAVSTEAFTVTGDPAPTVTKASGNASITWDNTNKKLHIAAGLAAGTYPVVLTASNGTLPNATLTFTLTVNTAPIATGIIGPKEMKLLRGYAAATTDAFTVTGSAPVTVTLNNNQGGKITWNDTTKRLEIAPGLAAGDYTVVLTASNGTAPDATATFKLTVAKTVFNTKYESTVWNWIMFFILFGFIWMW